MTRKIYPPQTKKQKFSNWIIVAAIALMGLATYWIVKNNYHSGSKSHEFIPGEQHAELHIFFQSSEKPLENANIAIGDKLVFSMSSTFPAHIALVEIAPDKKAHVVFSGTRIPPGKSHPIEIADERFVYTVVNNYPGKICLMATQSESDLNLALSRVGQGNEEQLASNCIPLMPQP